jgi:ABC-type phosphate transport system substrate-binding protein
VSTSSGRRGQQRRPAFLRRPARIAAVALISALGLVIPSTAASAGTYTTINGSGSSWASVALFQWANDVRAQGITVNYNPDGSAQGRTDFIQGGSVDFAGSDPPFRNGQDKLAGTGAETVPWGYSYVPDTAGGTAFMYHLDVGGQLIRNLRLTPLVLMEIFTGAITNWDDKQITKAYGAQLPNIPITPVIRSDGSGATFFFTRWMATMFPGQWDAFCKKVHPGISTPCGQTEFYPQFGNAKAQNGSNNVADYITSSYGQGAIGYDEYAYALNANYPVVQLLNPGGYYVGPTASNVAVALTHAVIDENPSDPNFLQQNLNNVYTFKDPRSYPLSSYSYLIVPRAGSKPLPSVFNTGAGRTLSTYINYFLCAGQKQMPALGYSPLPINLVSGAFLQVKQIPGTVGTPNINSYASCGNPTFINGKDVLLNTAPYPTACQKAGAPLNCVVKNGKAVAAGSSAAGHGSSGPSSSSTNGTSSSAANPATGGSGTSGPTAGAANVTGTVVNLASNGTDKALLAVLTALAVVAAVATPPAVGAWLRRRKRQAGT